MLDKKVEETGRGVTITLYGEATIQNASELKNIIMEQMNVKKYLAINLAYVTDCDLSFLQLICGAHKMSLRDGKTLAISERSSLVDDVASSSGFIRTSGCVTDGHPAQGCLWQSGKAGA